MLGTSVGWSILDLTRVYEYDIALERYCTCSSDAAINFYIFIEIILIVIGNIH